MFDNTTKSFFLIKVTKKIFGPFEEYLNKRILDMCIKNGNPVGFVSGNLSFVTQAGKFELTLKPELVEEAKALDEIRYKLKRDRNIFETYFRSALSKGKETTDIKASLPAIMHEWFDNKFTKGLSLNVKDSYLECPLDIEKLITLYIMYRMVL